MAVLWIILGYHERLPFSDVKHDASIFLGLRRSRYIQTLDTKKLPPCCRVGLTEFNYERGKRHILFVPRLLD
jgi:hypothetical protein